MQDPYNPDLKPDLREIPWIIRKLVQLAYALAPKQDKQWIKDMQFELSFIGKEQRLRWVLGALGLAFKLRFSSLEWVGTPRGMALATALAAAVAAVVFVPQAFLNPSQSNQPAVSIPTDDAENLLGVLSEPAAASDSATARAAENVAAAAPEQEAGQAVSLEETAEQAASGFQAQPELDVSVDTDAVDNVVTETEVETAPSETPSDAPTEAASAAPPLPSALALPTAPPIATEARERDETVSSAESSDANARLSDSSADEAQAFAPTLSILVKEEGSLQIYQSDSASAEALVLDREVLAGEQFSFNLPVYIVSDNAGGLELTLNGELLGALGEKGERLERVFEP